jgi:hypothetical protein
MVEMLNHDYKRRARLGSLFADEASLFRLVSAILMATSEQAKINRKYPICS